MQFDPTDPHIKNGGGNKLSLLQRQGSCALPECVPQAGDHRGEKKTRVAPTTQVFPTGTHDEESEEPNHGMEQAGEVPIEIPPPPSWGGKSNPEERCHSCCGLRWNLQAQRRCGDIALRTCRTCRTLLGAGYAEKPGAAAIPIKETSRPTARLAKQGRARWSATMRSPSAGTSRPRS